MTKMAVDDHSLCLVSSFRTNTMLNDSVRDQKSTISVHIRKIPTADVQKSSLVFLFGLLLQANSTHTVSTVVEPQNSFSIHELIGNSLTLTVPSGKLFIMYLFRVNVGEHFVDSGFRIVS